MVFISFMPKVSFSQNIEEIVKNADSLLESNQYKEAILNYNKAIEIDSLNATLFYNLARCYEETKELKKAMRTYSQVIALDSNNLEAYQRRGLIKIKTGNIEQGKKDIEIANSKKLSDGIDSILKFEKVVMLDSSYSQSYLFTNARQWISDNFKDANAVLTIQDKQSGELSGNGSFSFYFRDLGKINFKCSIIVKDGRYKYSFYNFEHFYQTQSYGGLGLVTTSELYPYKCSLFKGYTNKTWKEIKVQINSNMEILIASLEKAMKEKSKQDGW